jgi:endo-1,4-beta-xylanase
MRTLSLILVVLLHVASAVCNAFPKGSCANLTAGGARHGLLIGAAKSLSHWVSSTDSQYRTVWTEQYTLTTGENECKWIMTEPENGQFDFAACDAIVASSPLTRGHNLCWGTENPQWIMNASFTAAELLFYLTRHISRVVGHYANDSRVFCWDVVNEAVSDGPAGVPLLKRSEPWYPRVPDYIDVAFRTARQANPLAQLFYNDYGAEDMGPKSDRVFQLVSGMIERGVPIDGVGLQMHVTSFAPPNFTAVAENIRRLGKLGLAVHITEMDVTCGDPCDEEEEAAVYAGALKACLSEIQTCKSFETWDFTDRYSWLYNVSWNPFHVNEHPLPFSVSYTAKAGFYAMLDALCRDT